MSRLHHSNYQPRDSHGRFEKEQRNRRVTFRLTDDEYNALFRCAERRDWSMTKFVAFCAVYNDCHDIERRRLNAVSS